MPGTIVTEPNALNDVVLHKGGVARVERFQVLIDGEPKGPVSADGLVIVDQHAAHERIVFERMKAALRNGGVKRQMLLVPEIVELDDAAIERLVERADELAELGLVIERFGKGAVIVREVPALLGHLRAGGDPRSTTSRATRRTR